MASVIEFPIFTGVAGELRPWISWLEKFFVREKFTALEKLNLAQSLLDGDADVWFYRNQKILPFQSWEDLKANLWLMFGDFDDSDRIRRRSRTAIPAKDSIQEANSDPVLDAGASVEEDESREASMVKVEGNTAMFQILDSLEEESITQNQVHVSTLEHSLQFSKESPNVCGNSQVFVGCEHQSEMLQVLHVKEMEEFPSQSTNDNGDNGAHKLFDQMPSKEKRIRHRKGWKFKFKPSSKRPFQCLRLKNLRLKNLSFKKQAHMSRVLYQMRMLHDPGGKKDEHSDDIFETEVDIDNMQRTQMDTVAAESVITAPETVASSSNDVAPYTDVITKRQSKKPAHLTDSYCNPVSEIEYPISAYINYSQRSDEHKASACPVVLVCLSGASNSWCGWLVFDRGKNNIIAGDVITIVSIKELWIEIWDGDIAKLLNSIGDKLQSYGYVFEITFLQRLGVHQQKRTFTKSWSFKYNSRLKKINLTDTKFWCEEVQRVSCLSLAAQFHLAYQPNPELTIESETGSRRMTLLTMKWPENLVDLALDRLGNDTPIDEMVDFIVAAQLAEPYAEESEESLDGTEINEEDEDVVPVAARGPEVPNELLFKTMDKTLQLLDLGFSNHEISMAIDKIGTEGQISDLAESIVTGEVPGHFPDGLDDSEKKVSIWHRWRRKDCTRTSSCVVPLPFSFFKLEDKLVFRGEVLIRLVTWQAS